MKKTVFPIGDNANIANIAYLYYVCHLCYHQCRLNAPKLVQRQLGTNSATQIVCAKVVKQENLLDTQNFKHLSNKVCSFE